MMLFSRNSNPLNPEVEEKIKKYRRLGCVVPTRKMIKTEEQIEGIRASSLINTSVSQDPLCRPLDFKHIEKSRRVLQIGC